LSLPAAGGKIHGFYGPERRLALRCPVLVTKCIARSGAIVKTFFAKSETVTQDWYLIDAEGKTLGRLATAIADRLRGKHKPEFTPHVDTGDYIVVVNAEKIRVTGNKLKDKTYHRHTGHIGNMKSTTLEKLLAEHPQRALETAVRGMMPKNRLSRAMMKKLRIFAGGEHIHAAQQPKPLDL